MGSTNPTGITRRKGPEMLAFMSEFMVNLLEKEGLDKKRASEIGICTMERLMFEFGGQNLYFPLGIHQKTVEKAAEMYDKHEKGATIEELAHEYGHSIQWVYRLLTDERKHRRAQREAEREAARAKEQERWKREN